MLPISLPPLALHATNLKGPATGRAGGGAGGARAQLAQPRRVGRELRELVGRAGDELPQQGGLRHAPGLGDALVLQGGDRCEVRRSSFELQLRWPPSWKQCIMIQFL